MKNKNVTLFTRHGGNDGRKRNIMTFKEIYQHYLPYINASYETEITCMNLTENPLSRCGMGALIHTYCDREVQFFDDNIIIFKK